MIWLLKLLFTGSRRPRIDTLPLAPCAYGPVLPSKWLRLFSLMALPPLVYHFRECVVCEGVKVTVVESLNPTGHLVQKLLRYIWLLWEDPVEVPNYTIINPSLSPAPPPKSVRYQCKAMFNNMISIVKSLSSSAGRLIFTFQTCLSLAKWFSQQTSQDGKRVSFSLSAIPSSLFLPPLEGSMFYWRLLSLT